MQVAIGGAVLTAEDVGFVVEADRLGAHSVWVPEAWGQDALTPLAYLAARTERIRLGSGIAQIGARTPANLAMAALSLQTLSSDRTQPKSASCKACSSGLMTQSRSRGRARPPG